MKEKTGSSDRRRGSIPISLRDHSSRDRLCADHYDPTDTDEDATLRQSERNYFCSISPVLTLSGPRTTRPTLTRTRHCEKVKGTISVQFRRY